MQNSPPKRSLTRKSPRRARRGALMPAALLAVLVITVLLSQFASAQLRHASAARSEARAVWLVAIAADFDFYVHDRSSRSPEENPWSEAGSFDRALTDAERVAFEEGFLRVGVAHNISGFELDYQISRGSTGEDVFGALRLSALDERGRAEMCAVIARLARHGADGQGPTKIGTTGVCNTETISDPLIATAPLSGVNPAYVLRERRAGHPPPKFVGAGALDLGGCAQDGVDRNCDLVDVGSLIATGGGKRAAENDEERHATRVIGTLRSAEMSGRLTSVTGNVEIADVTRAKTLAVGGELTSGGLNGLPSDSDTGERGDITLNIDGIILIQDLVKTDTLTTAQMGNLLNHLTTQSMTLTGAADVNGVLTADTLHSAGVTMSGDLTAGQVFTKGAEIHDLEVEGRCNGC